MEPELRGGDLVLLDTRPVEPRRGAAYVFVDVDGSVRLKRLSSTHGTIYFVSANRDHPTEARTGDEAARIRIVGRVAWFARTMD